MRLVGHYCQQHRKLNFCVRNGNRCFQPIMAVFIIILNYYFLKLAFLKFFIRVKCFIFVHMISSEAIRNQIQCFEEVQKKPVGFFYAGVPEWSNGTPSRGVSLVLTKVRILSPACPCSSVGLERFPPKE